MQETATLGLRDRKRQETRDRLERAAVEIVLADGLESLTIDAISDHADVSPRTFFNYFDSKEDAILGLRLRDDTDQLVAEALDEVQATDLIDGVIQLLAAMMGGTMHDKTLRKGRKTILHQHPELLHRQFSQMNRKLDILTSAVQTLMARIPGADGERECSSGEAQIVLMMCGAAIRASATELACNTTDPLRDDSIDLMRKRADTLVREVLKKLQ